jgi:hypothetical protein
MTIRNEPGQMTQVIEKIGAGEGNRTLVISLEGCMTTKPIKRIAAKLDALSP